MASRCEQQYAAFHLTVSAVADECPEDEHDDGPASPIRYVYSILSSLTFAPFTTALAKTRDWSPEQCRNVVEAAQAELRTRSADVFFKL